MHASQFERRKVAAPWSRSGLPDAGTREVSHRAQPLVQYSVEYRVLLGHDSHPVMNSKYEYLVLSCLGRSCRVASSQVSCLLEFVRETFSTVQIQYSSVSSIGYLCASLSGRIRWVTGYWVDGGEGTLDVAWAVVGPLQSHWLGVSIAAAARISRMETLSQLR